ncbi:MAG: type II secretion system protein [Deltaproteobacteria bacterium]|nr:type II secretion system protein [Deltaproteobacteria bacterium]
MASNNKGFTLIELVLVITILGILAVAALPSFIDISTNARQSSMSGVVGAVRSGISLYRSNDIVKNGPPGLYPTTLDAAAAGAKSTADPFYSAILQQPLKDTAWKKDAADANVYIFNDGTSTCTYTYVAATGAFTGVSSDAAKLVCP